MESQVKYVSKTKKNIPFAFHGIWWHMVLFLCQREHHIGFECLDTKYDLIECNISPFIWHPLFWRKKWKQSNLKYHNRICGIVMKFHWHVLIHSHSSAGNENISSSNKRNTGILGMTTETCDKSHLDFTKYNILF